MENYFLFSPYGLVPSEKALAASAFGQFSSLVTQVPSASGASLVKMDSVENLQNLEISKNKDKIIIKEAGYYFVIATGQIGGVSVGAKGYMDIWFVKNDVAIPNSNNRMTITDYRTIGVLRSQFIIKLAAGDTFSTSYSASAPSFWVLFSLNLILNQLCPVFFCLFLKLINTREPLCNFSKFLDLISEKFKFGLLQSSCCSLASLR